MVFSFDLTIWSEWASVAGFLLSIWVLIRTYRVEQAVRTTESAIYRRLSLPGRIGKIDSLSRALRALARESSPSEPVDAHELFGQLDALVRQLQDIPDPDIRECLGKICGKRYHRLVVCNIKRTMTLEALADILELLAELSDHINEYKSQADLLGRRE